MDWAREDCRVSLSVGEEMKKNDGDYRRLKRLSKKRHHAVDTWEKKSSLVNLENVYKFTRLLFGHIKKIDKK